MIWLAGGLLAVVILQTTIAPWVQLGQVRPDLFLLLLYLGSFRMNPTQACLMGCLLGLYEDALSGAPLGLNAFTLSLLGYVLVRVREEVDENRLFPQLVLLFLTGLSAGLITSGVLAFFGMGRNFGESLLWIILPGAMYTMAVGGLLLFGTRLGRIVQVRL
ncbi:MAG: rod shape-determining protein MreD [candidate division NC10 bacterium]|nr:rod shape-determining protein MreD [candidate division NC10 bacterium]